MKIEISNTNFHNEDKTKQWKQYLVSITDRNEIMNCKEKRTFWLNGPDEMRQLANGLLKKAEELDPITELLSPTTKALQNIHENNAAIIAASEQDAVLRTGAGHMAVKLKPVMRPKNRSRGLLAQINNSNDLGKQRLVLNTDMHGSSCIKLLDAHNNLIGYI